MRKAKKSPWRFLFLTGAVISGAWLAFYGVLQVIAMHFLAKEAASIGIIGGADGPTAIFLATRVGINWNVVLMTVIFAAGILGVFLLRRRKNKK